MVLLASPHNGLVLNFLNDVLLDSSILLVQQNKLVRNYAHLLEGQCLQLSAWESLDDPALLIVFHQLNLQFDKFNDNGVLHIGVSLSGLFNLLSVLRSLLDFLVDQIANGDTSKVAILGQVLS